MKRDEELEAAKKRDAYERAERLPEKFHEWGLVIDRIRDAPVKAPAQELRGMNHDGCWIDDAAFGPPTP